MNNQHRINWDRYSHTWKLKTAEEKRAQLEQCMSERAVYRDPLVEAHTMDELVAYMLEFHQQIPGGHFVVTHYQTHHGRSIAEWEMRNGENLVLGTGTSFAEYDEAGKILSATGFFEVPNEGA